MTKPKSEINVGDGFGYLTVTKELEPIRKDTGGIKQRVFELGCVCGAKVTRQMSTFFYGKSASCGCMRSEIQRKAARGRADYHGMKDTSEYKSWTKIKERSFNKNDPCYPHYGAKGVVMCDEWVDDFLAFYQHIGPKPDDGNRYSVDRIDNTLGYEPYNVRWATYAQQARNKNGLSKANKTGVIGVSWEDKLHPNKVNSTMYAVAQWKTINGKPRKKSFSVKKYGEELAFFMACEYRDYQIDLLNLQGAGYTDQHLNRS